MQGAGPWQRVRDVAAWASRLETESLERAAVGLMGPRVLPTPGTGHFPGGLLTALAAAPGTRLVGLSLDEDF